MNIQESLQKLNEQRAKASKLPLSALSEYIAGKRLFQNGKTLMQCFESDATAEDRAKGTAVFQAYLVKGTTVLPNLIEKHRGDNGKLSFQAMQVSTDFPLWTASPNPLAQNLDDVDTGWVRAFRELRFDEGRSYLEYGVSDTDLEFFEMMEGQNYRANDMSATKYTLNAQKYGMAYQITDETMLYNSFEANVDVTAAMMNAYAKKMQAIHYGVLADSATTNVGNLVAWVAGSNTLERDIRTINAACDYLYGAMRNKMSNAASARVVAYVYGNDSFTTRMKMAMNAIAPNLQTGSQVTSRPIEIIPTSNLATSAGVAIASTRVEFVIPGRLIVRGVKRDLMMERYRDQSKDINVTKANFYCGAGVSDTTQTVFADFA